jgi:hypothetical protein
MVRHTIYSSLGLLRHIFFCLCVCYWLWMGTKWQATERERESYYICGVPLVLVQIMARLSSAAATAAWCKESFSSFWGSSYLYCCLCVLTQERERERERWGVGEERFYWQREGELVCWRERWGEKGFGGEETAAFRLVRLLIMPRATSHSQTFSREEKSAVCT